MHILVSKIRYIIQAFRKIDYIILGGDLGQNRKVKNVI